MTLQEAIEKYGKFWHQEPHAAVLRETYLGLEVVREKVKEDAGIEIVARDGQPIPLEAQVGDEIEHEKWLMKLVHKNGNERGTFKASLLQFGQR